MICCKIALLCLDNFSTLSLQNYIYFLAESKRSSLWRFCWRWWHRELSVRQITVLPVTGGIYPLADLCFQCSFNIFTLHFTVMSVSLKCIRYFSFVHLFCHAWISSLPYYRSIFLFLTEGRGSSTWRLCRRRWHRELSWRQVAIPLVMAGLALFCSRCTKYTFNCFIYVFNPNNLHIYFKSLHVIDISIQVFMLYLCIHCRMLLILYKWFTTFILPYHDNMHALVGD